MKAFTKREKFLLGILIAMIAGAVYYFLLFQPLQTRIVVAALRMADAENAQLVEQARTIKYGQMKKELEEMKAAGLELSSEIPDYNNLRNVMIQLDSILTMASSYDIAFADVIVAERTITRPVRISFTASNYQRAKEIIQALADCRYRCTVDGVDMQDADKDADMANLRSNVVEVSLLVNFYERNTMPAPVAELPAQAAEETPAA